MKSRPPARPGRILSLAAFLLSVSAYVVLAAEPAATPPDSVGGSLLYIRDVVVGRSECATCPPIVCPDKPILVTVRGEFPTGCYKFRGLRWVPTRLRYPVLAADIVVDTCQNQCSHAPVPFAGRAELPPAPPGPSEFVLIEQARRCPDTTIVSAVLSRRVAFEVQPECPSVPPPPDSLVKTFVSLRTLPERPCAGDSVTLQLVENGCTPCVHLTSFGFSPTGALEGVIDWTPVCNELRCASDTLSTPLGRMAQGSFVVNASMTVRVHDLPNPDTTIHFVLRHEFQVGPACPDTLPPCVQREMFSNQPPHRCEVTLRPGQGGDVPVFYSSELAMGGMQGTIEVPPPFRLVGLRLATHRTGVHLSWTQQERGARWLVFTDPGITLEPGTRQHLLDVTIAADMSATNGQSGLMLANLTLAASPDGRELPFCIRHTLDLVVIATRLCVAGEPTLCDINRDGRLDVRDLVRMVTCLDSLPHNTKDESPCRDCNADGTFDLSDIFCCAGHILRGPLVSRDSVISDARVQVSFDPPEPVGDAWLVRVHVRGANALGAALLRFEYPGDRWRVEQAMVRDPGPLPVDVDWYPLADLDEPGRVHLGGLRMGQTGSDDLVFHLLISPTGVPQPGDRFVAVGADLAAVNGAVLTPMNALPSLPLDGIPPPSAGISLSSPRPNPFTTSTQFVVTLPSTSQVDLAVLDLAGRRVATIASGLYGPGQHPFTWDGGGAHDGLYFVRLDVNGQAFTTRAALLRDSRP